MKPLDNLPKGLDGYLPEAKGILLSNLGASPQTPEV